MHLDDTSILNAIATNKERGFHLLVDAYSGMVFNTCLHLLRNREDAEDLTQEVFTSLYTSLETFEGNSKLSTWIYAIALNKSKEFLRHKTRKKRFGFHTTLEKEESHIVPLAIIEFEHPGVQLEDKEQAAVLFAAIDQLAEKQKMAFIFHKIEGRSYQEIAELLEVTVPSVESLMFRAKQRLQKILRNYYEENL